MNKIKEEDNDSKILDINKIKHMNWEKTVKDQLVFTLKNLTKHPVGTEEQRQFVEVFTFWLQELLCIQNTRMDLVA